MSSNLGNLEKSEKYENSQKKSEHLKLPRKKKNQEIISDNDLKL